jgi:hypothetical protein
MENGPQPQISVMKPFTSAEGFAGSNPYGKLRRRLYVQGNDPRTNFAAPLCILTFSSSVIGGVGNKAAARDEAG